MACFDFLLCKLRHHAADSKIPHGKLDDHITGRQLEFRFHGDTQLL